MNVGDPNRSSRREVLTDKRNSEEAEMVIRKSERLQCAPGSASIVRVKVPPVLG